jgi:hypothetical protein
MPGTASNLPRLYTAAEVAEALRCSTWWVQEQVRRRRVPYCEVAGGCRFTVEHYAVILRLLERLPLEEFPHASARTDRPAVPASDVPTAGLQARVPRRLRDVPSFGAAA